MAPFLRRRRISRDCVGRIMMSKFSCLLLVLAAGIVWLWMINIALFTDIWTCQSEISTCCFSLPVILSSKCKKASTFPDFIAIEPRRPRKCCPIPFAKDPEELINAEGRRTPDKIVKSLSYIMEDEPDIKNGSRSLPPFSGHKRWLQREESFKLNSTMKVHCGFTQSSGAEMTIAEMQYVKKCKFVVASGIFYSNSKIYQPINISVRSRKLFCFVMLVDEKFLNSLKHEALVKEDFRGGLWVGIWRLIPLKNLPYSESDRNEEVIKLLIHRLIPQAQYSIWISSKMVLVADPFLILERYLWREGHSFAISQHGYHHSIYEEANASKSINRHLSLLIDAQMKVYHSGGLKLWSRNKKAIDDVPEASIIIREHTILNNLFSCLWFNEVHLFTPLDQLSFGYVAGRLGESFKYFMFPYCEYNSLFVLHYYPRSPFEYLNKWA